MTLEHAAYVPASKILSIERVPQKIECLTRTDAPRSASVARTNDTPILDIIPAGCVAVWDPIQSQPAYHIQQRHGAQGQEPVAGGWSRRGRATALELDCMACTLPQVQSLSLQQVYATDYVSCLYLCCR